MIWAIPDSYTVISDLTIKPTYIKDQERMEQLNAEREAVRKEIDEDNRKLKQKHSKNKKH